MPALHAAPISPALSPLVSPLVLADRLLSLAQDADRAGLHRPAARLLRLAYALCDEPCAAGAPATAWPA